MGKFWKIFPFKNNVVPWKIKTFVVFFNNKKSQKCKTSILNSSPYLGYKICKNTACLKKRMW